MNLAATRARTFLLSSVCYRLKRGCEIIGSLEEMMRAEKGQIVAERSTFQRFFSLKALHGILMFTSWINIVGRIFASNQSGDFTCHTYPVYKQVRNKNQSSFLVDITNLTYKNVAKRRP